MDAAHAYYAMNDLDLAEPHLQWLVESRPGEAFGHAGMALLLLQRGQLDAAQDQAQQAVDRNPDALEGHLALGMVFARTGRPQQAGDQFRLILDRPDVPPWLRERVEQFLNQNKP
jgi:predicted Zn-dependent protease